MGLSLRILEGERRDGGVVPLMEAIAANIAAMWDGLSSFVKGGEG